MIVGAGPQRSGVRTAACGEDEQSVQAPTVEDCWSGARRQTVGASTAAVGAAAWVAAGAATSFTGAGNGAESLMVAQVVGQLVLCTGGLCFLPARQSVEVEGGFSAGPCWPPLPLRCCFRWRVGMHYLLSKWCFAIVSRQVACLGCSKPCGACVPAGGTGITSLACSCRGCCALDRR